VWRIPLDGGGTVLVKVVGVYKREVEFRHFDDRATDYFEAAVYFLSCAEFLNGGVRVPNSEESPAYRKEARRLQRARIPDAESPRYQDAVIFPGGRPESNRRRH
jgi:hypothetical protein